MLQRALDRRVQRIQPVERQRLGGVEAGRSPTAHPARARIGPVVGEDAVQERQAAFGRKFGGGVRDELRPDRQVSDQPSLVTQLKPGAVGEFACLADVVQQGGRH